MIVFQTLKYKNFLASGNVFTEFDLAGHQLTLIIGSNGAGKSTAIDALTFGLYGKTIRNINKPTLVNSMTNRELVVEIQFKKGKNEYLVRRGIKPTIFEIFCNDQMIDQPSDLKDYQDLLEKQILQINFKAFCQIVVLGSKNYIPFLSLTAQARREIVEDLLDIQVFSMMNGILKDRLATEKFDLANAENHAESLQSKIDLLERIETKLAVNQEEERKTKLDKIASLESLIASKTKAMDDVKDDIARREAKFLKARKYSDAIGKIIEARKKTQKKIDNLNKQLAFYDQKECPTCHQELHTDEHAAKIQELYDNVNKAEARLKELYDKSEEITKAKGFMNESTLSKFTRQTSDLHNTDLGLQFEIRMAKQTIEEINKELKTKKEIEKPAYDIDALRDELAKTKQITAAHKEQMNIMTVSGALLKDGGIKAHIIKQYIPIMNSLINKYLAKFDFFLSFSFDENFTEHISARFKDTFSYGNFSEGEKFRINLAILFAWREIARIRNSSSVNLLIMDEIFDSSLDVDGTDEFMKIIGELGKENNLFIISHKVDSIIDKFQHVIRIAKNKHGFSHIKEKE